MRKKSSHRPRPILNPYRLVRMTEIMLTNRQTVDALNTLRSFGAQVPTKARLKYHLALIAAALAPHADTVTEVQQQLQKQFLGEDPSKAEPKAQIAFGDAVAEVQKEMHAFSIELISTADWETILNLDSLPCPLEPLLPLLAAASAPAATT